MPCTRTGRWTSLSLAAALLAGSGCGTPETRRADWQAYDGPGREHFLAEEVEFPTADDPAERWNRPVGALNFGVLVYVLDPVYQAWSSVTPQGLRDALGRAGANLQFPRRAVNDALQGRTSDLGDETARFLINTTVGLLGLFDPAREWWDIAPPPSADFGQTFATWGWDETHYWAIPFLGPATVRDAVGRPLDLAAEPVSYVTGAAVFDRINRRGHLAGAVKRFVAGNTDPYEKGKVLATVARDRFVFGGDSLALDEPPVTHDTVQFAFLAPRDATFVDHVEHGTAVISKEREIDYSLWLQDDDAPIVYLLPGLGGYREDPSNLALAEMVFRHGYTAVVVSNALNHEFMRKASTAAVPGYAPLDAADVHDALTAIDRDLTSEHGDRIGRRVLMGTSLGAFHTLYIAAGQVTPQPGRMRFDRFVAVNPPVSLRRGLAQLDRLYNAPLVIPKERRAARIDAILRKAASLLLAQGARPTDTRLLTQVESDFLIGATFRLALGDVILASQLRHDMGVLATPLDTTRRTHLYREIREYSWIEYVYAFVLPSLQKRFPELDDVEDLFERCDLRWLGWRLGHCDTTRVLTSADDFLLGEGDLAWLERTLPAGNLTVWPAGGHMGHLFHDDVQADIMASLWDLRFVEGTPSGR